MSSVNIKFQNYKLLKGQEFNLENGSIIFIQGPNEVGKSTLVNAIKALMEVKDETNNPVSFGEKEGYWLGNITGADGNQYQFRYDFNIDGKKKFIFIDKDGKSIKTIGEMRAIFNYTHFTIEEFFAWSKTTEGRKKQAEILLKLLSEKEVNDINNIDAKINTTTGELYIKRQNTNKEVDQYNTIVTQNILTVEETGKLSKKESANKLSIELTLEKERLDKIINNPSAELIIAKQKEIETLKTNYETNNTSYQDDIDDFEKQIKELQTKLEAKKTAKIDATNEYNTKSGKLGEELKELQKDSLEENIEECKIQLETLNTRLESGKTLLNEITKIEAKKNVYDTNKALYDEKKELSDNLSEQIETLRKEKKNIIKQSPNIPAGYELTDDGILVDGLPMLETDISKSHAIKAIAELMMKVNKAPIMLMGDADSLGYPVLEELNKLASENDKLMIFAEHVRTLDEMQVVCYDEIDKPETEQKELF